MKLHSDSLLSGVRVSRGGGSVLECCALGGVHVCVRWVEGHLFVFADVYDIVVLFQ